MNMNLNERIEAGRSNAVAQSFQAASEIPNMLECAAQDGYPLEMDDKLSNSEKGRQTALANRIRKSERDDSRFDVAIIEAALTGAKTLKSLASALNSAGVMTRSGRGAWSISLVSTEMERMGYSIKALNLRLAPPKGGDLTKGSELALRAIVTSSGLLELSQNAKDLLKDFLSNPQWLKSARYSVIKLVVPKGTPYDSDVSFEASKSIDDFMAALRKSRPKATLPTLAVCMQEDAMTWSEESFWEVARQELRLAERKGEWLSVTDIGLKGGDLIHHPDHGYGTYFDGGEILRCRYQLADGKVQAIYLNPKETKAFRWKSDFTPDMRANAFAHIRATYLTDAELVEPTSITLAQRLARSRAIRWP
jgi:hypothetical protein